jgi:hypothetical protein
MPGRSAFLAVLLFPVLALAQTTGEEPKACARSGAPPTADYERENVDKEWPAEATRMKGQEKFVSRRRETLRLAVDGRTVELEDCPYGDTAYQYLFERLDDSGRFYVVRTPGFEDFRYTLVMRSTGRLFTVYGAPVWAWDKTRFLTVACSLLPERATLTVHQPTGDGIATEAEIPLPCALESCSARWDFQSWITVSCTPYDDPGKKGTEFVVIRGNDGSWKKFGR